MKFPALLLGLAMPVFAAPEPPRSTDEKLTIELVAAEPDVRTPTAIGVDGQGRIWVLENNTHFRPKNYQAPPTDRVLILEDFDANGRARKITTFADGFQDGMGMWVLGNGAVIVSTRAEIIRFEDSKQVGVADRRQTLLRLQTEDKYPHNGLSGLARDPAGHFYLGLGENHGSAWQLTGTDGIVLSGSDEGGVFRFEADGSGLTWWALGFWNPFGLAFDRENRLFALDNDPSGGSLCRFIHVIPGGDYGFRYRYGRTVQHPFVAWQGELPGTLPPVCLSGEAPTGLISFKSTGLGAGNADQFLGATWTDHGIQRFPLTARGVSFGSKPEWLVQGGRDFRPSGLAEAPDGSLVIADWADGAYEVHGKGRIWRLRSKIPVVAAPAAPPTFSPADPQLTALLDGRADLAAGLAAVGSTDPFLFRAGVLALARLDSASLIAQAGEGDVRAQLGVLLALRRQGGEAGRALLPKWLTHPDGALRRAALQWISEEGLKQFEVQLESTLNGQPSRETFQAYLAAVQMLSAGKPDPKVTLEQTLAVALDPNRAGELRALALRLLPPNAPSLTVAQLSRLLGESNLMIRLEAIRILALRSDADGQAELRRIAGDPSADMNLRAEAFAGLAASASSPETQALLRASLELPALTLRREARRSLGEPSLSAETPSAGAVPAAQVLASKGDPNAGRRLFYHPNGPRCFVCHSVDGRGGAVGPELTQIGRVAPAQILEAIREPSKDIAPAFGTWHLQTKNGNELLGIDQFDDNKSQMTLVDAAGTKTRLNFSDLVIREPLPVSLMPPGLDAQLTVEELRDLLAFLARAR